MSGGVRVPLQLGRNAACFLRRKALIKAGRMMNVQVVGDQDDALGVGIALRDQMMQDQRTIKRYDRE